MSTWLLVADSSLGRLFKVDKEAKKLIEVEELLNSEGRLQDKEFYSDSPGRAYDSGGMGRHLIEEGKKKKQRSREQFAHELAMCLRKIIFAEKVNHVFIVAPSKMLGCLGSEFDNLNCNCDVEKIAKELASMSTSEIFDHLKKQLLVNKII